MILAGASDRKDSVMAYHHEKRNDRRVPVTMDAELITSGETYAAVVENISDCCVGAKIVYDKVVEYVLQNDFCYLRFYLPSGMAVHLKCRKIWSDRNTLHSLIEHVAFELIDPPREYGEFLMELSRMQY